MINLIIGILCLLMSVALYIKGDIALGSIVMLVALGNLCCARIK